MRKHEAERKPITFTYRPLPSLVQDEKHNTKNKHTKKLTKKVKRRENKCGNLGFYPRVMCTAKSV